MEWNGNHLDFIVLKLHIQSEHRMISNLIFSLKSNFECIFRIFDRQVHIQSGILSNVIWRLQPFWILLKVWINQQQAILRLLRLTEVLERSNKYSKHNLSCKPSWLKLFHIVLGTRGASTMKGLNILIKLGKVVFHLSNPRQFKVQELATLGGYAVGNVLHGCNTFLAVLDACLPIIYLRG